MQLLKNLDTRLSVQPEETITEEYELVEHKELIKIEPNEIETFNEVGILIEPSNFIISSNVDFVIKINDEVEIFVVEFKLDGVGKPYYIEGGIGGAKM